MQKVNTLKQRCKQRQMEELPELTQSCQSKTPLSARQPQHFKYVPGVTVCNFTTHFKKPTQAV